MPAKIVRYDVPTLIACARLLANENCLTPAIAGDDDVYKQRFVLGTDFECLIRRPGNRNVFPQWNQARLGLQTAMAGIIPPVRHPMEL